ncbi:MAG: hypothetical protein WA160_12145 [Pseudobdellovibrio sp.]
MKLLNTILILVSIFSAKALAVRNVGNGGVGVLCENSTSQQQLELFDIFEGKSLLGLFPIPTSESHIDIANRNILKFANLFNDKQISDVLQKKLSEIIQNLKILPIGVGLELTDDVDNFIKPKNCKIVQIINFRNDGQVYADSDFWNLLDSTNKAAALVHETIYWYLRQTSTEVDQKTGHVVVNEVDSARVRKIVSYLFSNQPLQSLGTERGNALENRIKCSNYDDIMAKSIGTTEFILLTEQGQIKARFIKLSGKLIVSRTEATFEKEEGLQELPLNSLIDKEISIDFGGYTTLEEMKKIGGFYITIHDTNQAIEYTTQFQCYNYN